MVIFMGEYKFESYKFIDEYLNFLGSLISIAFGFWLVNVLWEKKAKNEKVNQAKRILLIFLIKINQFSKEIKKILSIQYNDSSAITRTLTTHG